MGLIVAKDANERMDTVQMGQDAKKLELECASCFTAKEVARRVIKEEHDGTTPNYSPAQVCKKVRRLVKRRRKALYQEF